MPGCVLPWSALGLLDGAAREQRLHEVGDRPRHAGVAASLQEDLEALARLGLGAADLAQPQ